MIHGDPGDEEWAERWSADVVLSDGSTTHVRPILPSDGDALRAFHERQSRESIYFRFFSPRPRLSDKEVEHLTTVDGIDRMAFVAERSGDLLGVAQYDRVGDQPEAEVAFFTDDKHHGRGIATLLLEYLAAYAREAGLRGFEAHVLPSNRRMVSVFKQAGFQASSEFADGIIEVTLGIEPTESAAQAMAQRAASAERQAVVRLLEPEAVAVVGAGRNPDGIGHRTLLNLLRGGFRGPVYPVHPEAHSLAGVRAHRRVSEIDDQVDLAIICVPVGEVVAVIEDCGSAGVDAAIVISAGFAEVGPEGREVQEQVLAAARRHGLRILGPNCLGVVNTDPSISLHATFAEIAPVSGRVGLLSQSGTLGAVILERARSKGLGISTFVAVGNKADLSGNDILQYWLDDQRTDVVLLYLESFGNPRRFGRNVRQVARTKPVFAVRSGAVLERDDDGALDDETIDALLRETGVVRVPTISALLDAALVAGNQPVPAGAGVAVVGNSGGSASMAADACAEGGLHLAQLSEQTLHAIEDLRLHGRRIVNPIDLRHDATSDDYERVLDAVLTDPAVDAVLVTHAPYDRDQTLITAALDAVNASHPDATILACIHGPHTPLTRGGVPVFDFPDEAALALGRLVRHRVWLDAENLGSVRSLDNPVGLRALVRGSLRSLGPLDLPPEYARSVLLAGGVDAVPVQVLLSRDDVEKVEVTEPVAVKAERHAIGAATRDQGVALDVTDHEDLVSAVDTIANSLGDMAWPILVQKMTAPGTNVRVAIDTHPVVGPVICVGPGGGAGRFAHAPRRVLPITDRTADDLIDSSGLAALLAEPSRDRLLDLIQRLAAIVDAAPEIVEVECDPVIVRPDGADIVDVRITVASVDNDDEPSVRRLPG